MSRVPVGPMLGGFCVAWTILRRDAHYRSLAIRRQHTTHAWSLAARHGEPRAYTFPVYVICAEWQGDRLRMGTP